jgi:hypothetical protein
VRRFLRQDAIEQLHVLAEVPRPEERFTHAGLSGLADPFGFVGVGE